MHKFIIHIFGSKNNHDIHLFFSNLSEIKTVHFYIKSSSSILSINYETWWKIIANIIALVTQNIAVSSTKEKKGKPYFYVQEQILRDTIIFTLQCKVSPN